MKLNEDNGAVKVAVREKPICKREMQNSESIISYHSINNNILIIDGRPFSFDHALGPEITQKQLFDELIRPLIAKTLQGFFCTALAYGQTGTGKTFTMGLHSENFNDDELVGVIPRALNELFNSAQHYGLQTQPQISVSFVETYNEKVFDLFSEDTTGQINTKGYKFTGGIRIPVTNLNEGYQVLANGNKNRHVRPTKMNLSSSRSHAIFTIHVVAKTDVSETSASLHLVDLAGSEGVRRTGHEGLARAEGVCINKGLLCIGKVLQALSTGNKVIPYRDSVLSLVLQDSLNTNSYLTLLACISPYKEDLSETLSTLRFAENAKNVKNSPQVNSILLEIQKNKENRTKTPSKELSLLPKHKTKQNGSAQKKPLSATKRPGAFNTFCTPNKIKKIDVQKFNLTEIGLTQKEKSKRNIKQNLFELDCLNRVNQRKNDFNFNKGRDYSIDSRSSLMALNLSASTAINAPVSNSFSPLLRKMSQMESTMEQVLDKIQIINSESKPLNCTPEKILTTPSVPNDVCSTQKLENWSSIKNELREIVRNEMLSFSVNNATQQASIQERSRAKAHSRCQLFSESQTFKVPVAAPLDKSERTDILSNASLECSGNNFSQDIDQTVLYHPRRSTRLSLRKENDYLNTPKSSLCLGADENLPHRPDLSIDVMRENDDSNIGQANTMCGSRRRQTFSAACTPPKIRRSARLSMRRQSIADDENSIKEDVNVLNTQGNRRRSNSSKTVSTSKRRSVRMSKENAVSSHTQNSAETKGRDRSRKVKVKNVVIASYLNMSTIQEMVDTPKKDLSGAKSKHRKAILDMFNTGSMKELQFLPRVGLKTAYQIVTYRTLNGRFKSIKAIEKAPLFPGKLWDRFKEANNISDD